MPFPYEAVPDGNVFAPHHIYVGLIFMHLALKSVWDNQDGDPLWTQFSLFFLLIAFTFVWPTWPAVIGALMSLGMLVAIVVSVVRERRFFEGHMYLMALFAVGYYIAVDDVVEHAFGWPMPLDVFFKEVMVPLINML